MHLKSLKCVINQTHKMFFQFCLGSIRVAVIGVLCLTLAGGLALAEPFDSPLFAKSDNLKSKSASPKPSQQKKASPSVNKVDTIKKLFSPKKNDIGTTPGDPGVSGVEPEEPHADDNNKEQPASIRPFQGGGSLLGRGLPPPPVVLPSVTKKDPDIIEPGEVVIISADMKEAQTIAKQSAGMGFSIKRRRILKGLGLVISVLRLPEGKTVSKSLKALRGKFPQLWTDANHRYQLQSGKKDGVKRYGHKLIGWEPTSNRCGAGLRIGLVDTMMDTNHPALKGQRLATRSFLSHGVKPAPMNHGTAIAALLIGSPRQGSLAGLLPSAKLYAAGIFRQRGKRNVDTTAELVVLALDWLIHQKVFIINLSLGGPRNLMIEAVVQRVQALGVTLTAAAGNSGKKAPPVYPAAHEGVVAVTAIDARLKPYRLANRGDYISFAAPGVDIWTAKPGGGGTYTSGTSFAVPFITATIGAARIKRHGISLPNLLRQIKNKARDLGKPGKDPVFGWGMIQPGRCANRKN